MAGWAGPDNGLGNLLKQIYFDTPAPQALSAPPQTVRGRIQDGLASVMEKVGYTPRHAQSFAGKATGFVNDVTPVGSAISADDAKTDFQQGNYAGAAGNGLLSLLGLIPDGGALTGKGLGALHAIIAPLWHGSPKAFEKFSLSHIGTGEGNQAYGHGLYFAENPSVASTYAVPRMAEPQDVPDEIRARLKDALGSQDYLGFDSFGQAINAVRQHRLDFDKRWEVDNADEIRNALQAFDDHRWLPSDRPTLYQTQVNANPSDFASWDELGPASERVARANGMAGVRFLDNHSRYGVSKDNTSNYVVFDPSIVDILGRQ